ncbi:MAG: acyltransferase [Candidatus Eutrophobiaceae bacterium]
MTCLHHPTAIVDEGASIGDGTRIWHWTHISTGARIGKDCSLGQNVFVGRNAIIGDRVKIQNNVSVYQGVHLEDDVFCGPSAVFTNVRNPRSFIKRGEDQFLSTRISRGATLGAGCVILCGVTVAEYSFIAAGAVVTRDVPAFALMLGNPARWQGWMSRSGERLELPATGDAECSCPHTGERYALSAGEVRLLESHSP